MKTRIAPLAAAGLVLLSSACSRRPDGVLSDDEMTDVMVDVRNLRKAMRIRMGAVRQIPSLRGLPVRCSTSMGSAGLISIRLWPGMDAISTITWVFTTRWRVGLPSVRRIMCLWKRPVKTASETSRPYSRRMFISPKGDSDGFTFSVSRPDVKPGESLRWMMRLQFRRGRENAHRRGLFRRHF